MQRPPTSKPRGLCRYFKDPRGCYAGNNCKFLHADALPGPDDPPLLTPYDQNKRCKFYDQGYCKRGAACWFLHVDEPRPPGSEDDEPLCSICFEKPSTYGLLIQCSHIFCIDCIKQWRDPTDKPPDTISSGSIKSCPMCRTLSTSIVPSSRFHPHNSEERARVVAQYRESTARVDCRYFQKSLAKYPDRPLCPFGVECMYRHRKPDGTMVQLQDRPVVAMRRYHSAMDRNGIPATELFWAGVFPDTGTDMSTALRRHVEELRRQAALEVDNDLLQTFDTILPGMEEATRRTQVAMQTMELISDALVSAGRQRLDMQAVIQQFERIREQLIRTEEPAAPPNPEGMNLDEQLAERRRTSTSSRAMRYVRDLGDLADNMLVSINHALDGEGDDAGGADRDGNAPDAAQEAQADDMPTLIPVASARDDDPLNPLHLRLGRATSRPLPVRGAIRVRSPTDLVVRDLPPFAPAAAATDRNADQVADTIDISLSLAAASTIISLAEDAIRAERRAQDVLRRIVPNTEAATDADRLLADTRAVLPVLRAELQTSRTRLRAMRVVTPQQTMLVNERVDMLDDVMASIDASAARQRQERMQIEAREASRQAALAAAEAVVAGVRLEIGDVGDVDSDDDMPSLQSVSASSDDEDEEEEEDEASEEDQDGERMPPLRDVSSSDEGDAGDWTDTDSEDEGPGGGDGYERARARQLRQEERVLRAMRAVAAGEEGVVDRQTEAVLRTFLNMPSSGSGRRGRGGAGAGAGAGVSASASGAATTAPAAAAATNPAAPAAGVNSPRFSTVVDRTPSGRTPPPPATTDAASASAATSTSTSTSAPLPTPASMSITTPAHSPPTPHHIHLLSRTPQPYRYVASTPPAPPVPSVPPASQTAPPLPQAAPKPSHARRTSSDFTTDGRGRVISIGGAGCSREGLQWPVESAPDAVPEADGDNDSDNDAAESDSEEDGEDSAEHLAPPPATVRKISEFTTDGRGRVISVDSSGTSGNTATAPSPTEPSPASVVVVACPILDELD